FYFLSSFDALDPVWKEWAIECEVLIEHGKISVEFMAVIKRDEGSHYFFCALAGYPRRLERPRLNHDCEPIVSGPIVRDLTVGEFVQVHAIPAKVLPTRGDTQEIPLMSTLDHDPDDDRIALSNYLLNGQVKVGYRTEHSSKQADHVFDTLNSAQDPSVPLSVLCEELSKPVRIMLIEDDFDQLIDYLDVGLCNHINCHNLAVH